jgi:uncharacterized membrane protein YbhN (UPF0104 family)
MLAAGIAYIVLCAVKPGREWSVRGHRFQLPPLRMALLQLALSLANWATIGLTIYTLFGQRVDYPTVLAVLLVAAVAGVVTHIPAGLGVLEAVFIALIGHRVARDEILAALIAYRGLYYLLPLAIAVAVYLTLEARARKAAGAGDGDAAGVEAGEQRTGKPAARDAPAHVAGVRAVAGRDPQPRPHRPGRMRRRPVS